MALNAFFKGDSFPNFDYSSIRTKGEPIKGFGGVSSGYEPLKILHDRIYNLLINKVGKKITVTDITDIMNFIGVCVISGNVRRTAQIAFGDYDNHEYLKLKDYYWDENNNVKGSNAKRSAWGWASNNSIKADVGMDYTTIAEQISLNGEPGLFWQQNAKNNGRMNGETPTRIEKDIVFTNPCFAGDMTLLTDSGYKPFNELVNENSFIAINKNDEEVEARVWSNGIKKVYSINFYKEPPIRATEDHRFMLNDGTEEITTNLKGKRLMPYININKKIDEYVKYGFIQSDGSTGRLNSPRHLGLEIDFGEKDLDVANIFGFDTTGTKYVTGYNDILQLLGMSSNPLPTRDLPRMIYNWNEDKVASFLKGLFSANGSVIKNHRIALKSTNKNLITSVQDLLLDHFNIQSYITTNKTKEVIFKNGNYICKESYDLNIASFSDMIKFATNIGFIHNYKNESLLELIKLKSPIVRSVEYYNEEEVFDFSLNDNTHWGVVNGFIAHNCGEQTLESYEMCNLVELFLPNIHSAHELQRAVKFAYLYAKTVTLGFTSWPETNRVQLRNRRIGTSFSGIAQFVDRKGIHSLKALLNLAYGFIQKYDNIYSDWFAVPKSIKTTTIKPSGTISLLAGVTPGMHYPESPYYIRRMRIASNSSFIDKIKEAGYKVEPDINDPTNTSVVEFPIEIKEVRSLNDVSMWEQLSLAAFLQEHWSDNQVSCTVTFNKNEKNQIASALNYFQYKLKSISFLPKTEKGSYPQMPYEEITKDKYEELIKNIKPLSLQDIGVDSVAEKYCDTDHCEI